jgi:elongator complex protein 1
MDRSGHWSEILMHSTCTSFLLTPLHLLLTSHTHLKTIPFPAEIESGVEVPGDDIQDERIRQIERGSKLVTAMPSKHSIVLQAPRGNLETVSPRALVLGSVRQNLDRKEFKAAFWTCRIHRIDMNILWSYNEELFFQHVGLFVQQLQDVEYIDLFLSSLKEPPVMDKVPVGGDEKPSRHIIAADDKPVDGKKVSDVCNAVLAELLANYSSTHTQSILTAHLSKFPPDIPSSLKVIADLRGHP